MKGGGRGRAGVGGAEICYRLRSPHLAAICAGAPASVRTVAAGRGAERLVNRFIGYAGDSYFVDSFDKWEMDLWKTLVKVGE